MSDTTAFCLGFAFDHTLQQVVLIQKNRPDFLKGRWTGVGGHVEEGESAAEAMSREFQEEANIGTVTDRWIHLGEFGRSAAETLDVFAIAIDLSGVRSCTEEPVHVFDVNALPPEATHGRLLLDFITQAKKTLAENMTAAPVAERRARRSP